MRPEEFVIVGFILCVEPKCNKTAARILRRNDADFPYIARRWRIRNEHGEYEPIYLEPAELFHIDTDPGKNFATCPRGHKLDVEPEEVLAAFRAGTPENPARMFARRAQR